MIITTKWTYDTYPGYVVQIYLDSISIDKNKCSWKISMISD